MRTCPNCRWSDKGAILYKCSACGIVYCDVCSDFDMGSTACPDCGHAGYEVGMVDGSDDESIKPVI